MTSKRKTSFTSWALGLLTLAVLILNLPLHLGDVLGTWLQFVLLIAFTLNLGVLLTSGDANVAHGFAIMAFLVMGGSDNGAEALWAVAAGALIGSLIQVSRSDEWLPRRRMIVRNLSTVAETMAQLTLSLLVGETLYLTLNGRLPLPALRGEDALPLLALAVGFVLVYLLLYVLRVRLEGRQIASVLRTDWFTFSLVVLLPVPFGILGAVIATELDVISWTIYIAGLVLLTLVIYGFSRTQFHFRQQLDELSSLSVVSQALRSNLELNTLLETIYHQVSGLLGVDSFTVALLDPLHNIVHFPLVVRHGEMLSRDPRETSSTLLDYVLKTSTSLLIERQVNQRAAELGLDPPADPIYSWLGVPVLGTDRTLGAIAVASGNPEHLLGSGDERLLMNIAAQAGVAIENAQLYGQTQERALQLATLNSISTLLTGSLSPEKVINLVASSVVAVANCDAVAVYLYFDDRLSLVRNIGLSEHFSKHAPQPLIVQPQVMNDPNRALHQPVIISDMYSDPLVDETRRAVMEEEVKHAWVEIMLVSGEQPLGVIAAYYDLPRAFSTDEIELLRTFAVQAALAVNNARLYATTDSALNQRVSQLQALYDIGQDLTSTLNLQNIFDQVVSRALEGTRSGSAMLVIGAEDDLSLQAVASRGYPTGPLDRRMISNTGITAEVFDSGRPVLAQDVSQHPNYVPLNPATRSQLSVPIRRENETLGVITVESPQYSAFGDDDLTFVTQLATQASIAIDNARLFKQLAESRDRMQAILDSMTEGVLLIDRDGRISLVNPHIERLVGLKPSLLVGRLVDDLLQGTGVLFTARLGFTSSELRMLLADLRAGDLAAENAVQHTYELDSPRQLYINRQVAPVRDETGTLLGILLVFIDQTEQEEIARTREDLSRMIVHDLRGPLTAVTASLKLLNDVIPASSEYAQLVHTTTEASQRAVRKLLNLVDSLLDIAKMESGQLNLDRQPVALNAVCSNVVLEMDSLARELDVVLAVDVPYDLPELDIDAEQIERVLLNLVDNALKFTPAEGRVIIAARQPGVGAREGFVRIEVSDTGPGIPDEYKERLFTRFVQMEGTRGRRRGTGLGLSFCRLAVDAHGGQIWIEDNPAGGAVFAFTLPVATARPPQGKLSSDDTVTLL